jgi:hypothetical protein
MGREWGTDQDRASEALLMGKPAATDRPYLPSLSHSFTLDYVAAFQYESDAQRFYQVLGKRLAQYGLMLAADKTRLLLFSIHHVQGCTYSRTDRRNSGAFEFLGLEFRWGLYRHPAYDFC